jgi:hypothetical protein
MRVYGFLDANSVFGRIIVMSMKLTLNPGDMTGLPVVSHAVIASPITTQLLKPKSHGRIISLPNSELGIHNPLKIEGIMVILPRSLNQGFIGD